MMSSDPQRSSGLQDMMTHKQYAEGLVSFDILHGEVEPQLATDWTFSEDGTKVDFNLRDDVYFHNGDKMTADDVVWSMERCMDPICAHYTYTAGIVSVEKTGDYSVRFNLDAPNAAFLINITRLAVLNKKVVEEQGDEFGTKVEIARDEERIPSTRAPYHVMLRLKVDATARVAELAA